MASSTNATPAPSSAGPSSGKGRISTMPSNWEGVISAPMEENDASIFLHSLTQALDAHYLPTKRHFHLLLYLCATSIQAPLAQSTLSHLLTLYPPAALSKIMPVVSEHLPVDIPLKAEDDPNELPSWFKWPEHPLKKKAGWDDKPLRGLSRDAMRFISRGIGRNGGVWALLDGAQVRGAVQNRKTKTEDELKASIDGPKAKGKKRKSGAGDDDDYSVVEEEDEDEDRIEGVSGVICENGWVMLGSFVRLWKADQADHTADEPDEAWSPLFLAQLPHPFIDLAHDDASRIFKILKAGLAEAEMADTNSAERFQKLEISRDLLSLLIAPCISTIMEFHPPSLIMALIDLFRPLSPSGLSTGFTLIPSTSTLYPHLLTILTEDFAGVRVKKGQERKKSAEAMRRDFMVNWSKGQEREGKTFPPPTMGYVRELLLLRPAGSTAEVQEKMSWLKGQLVVWAGVNHGPGADWGFGQDQEWVGKYEKAMGDDENAVEILDIIRGSVGA